MGPLYTSKVYLLRWIFGFIFFICFVKLAHLLFESLSSRTEKPPPQDTKVDGFESLSSRTEKPPPQDTKIDGSDDDYWEKFRDEYFEREGDH